MKRKFCRKKLAVIAFIVLTFSIAVFGQDKTTEKYDSQLAAELGADDYGMRSYVLVLLKTGNAEITDSDKRKELFAGHFANMGRLAKDGVLVLAGPFIDGGENRGLFVFNVKTIEEANKLVMSDPAVKAGIFEAELTKWYGSAALLKINEIHSKIQKVQIE